MRKFLLALMSIALMAGGAFAQQKLQEVVYLKNGSIIRGVIIEQVPEKTIKIQTADGNVFVYSMSDVEKITKDQTTTTEVKPISKMQNTFKSSYQRVKFGYSPLTIDYDGSDSKNYNGLSLVWSKGISVSQEKPLYLEIGAGVLYAFRKDNDSYDTRSSLISVNIPAVITWRIDVDQTVKFSPYWGINMRGNIWGENKNDDYTTDWFDDDEGKRFNVGMTLGANFSFGEYELGFGYTSDFTEIFNKAKVKCFTISVGYNF